MLKICFVIPTLSGGGAERQLMYLSKYLVSVGQDVSVVYRSAGPDGQLAYVQNVEYIQLKSRSIYSLLTQIEL